MINLIVLTRFNLAIKFNYSRSDTEIPVWSDKPWLDEEYLEKRFRIFEKYTFPSLLGQTDKNFEWIVMFHKDTPELFKEKIHEFEMRMPKFKPMYFDDEECKRLYHESVRNYIKENYVGDIITTRIDNDDILHKTFIEDCKKQFINVEKTTVLTYVNGYQYDSRNNTVINYEFYSNHFLSLYVPYGQEIEQILSFDHSHIYKVIEEKGFDKIEKHTQIPMWIEIISQTNCSNHLKWRYNSFWVPIDIVSEYSEIEVRWNNGVQWLIYIAWGTCKIPFYYVGTVIKDIINKKRRMHG